MTDVGFEYEDDDNTPRHVAAGVPDDPVLQAAVRIVEHFGKFVDPVLSPSTAIEMAAVALGVES